MELKQIKEIRKELIKKDISFKKSIVTNPTGYPSDYVLIYNKQILNIKTL